MATKKVTEADEANDVESHGHPFEGTGGEIVDENGQVEGGDPSDPRVKPGGLGTSRPNQPVGSGIPGRGSNR